MRTSPLKVFVIRSRTRGPPGQNHLLLYPVRSRLICSWWQHRRTPVHARQLTGIREVFQERGLANQGRAPRRLVFRMPQVGPPAALDPVQVISATACRDPVSHQSGSRASTCSSPSVSCIFLLNSWFSLVRLRCGRVLSLEISSVDLLPPSPEFRTQAVRDSRVRTGYSDHNVGHINSIDPDISCDISLCEIGALLFSLVSTPLSEFPTFPSYTWRLHLSPSHDSQDVTLDDRKY